jgi:SNF2 family DNA or RNA helicase
LNQTGEYRGRHFALVLTTHRLWGKILLPYIIESEAKNKYFRLFECLSPYPADETLKNLENEEIELVRLTNEYSDKSIFKLFSKDNSVKDFLRNVNSEKIDKFIRPYIEIRLRKCLVIARDEGTLCFIRQSKSDVLHYEDQLETAPESALPLFRFDRQPEGSTYKLKIEYGGKPIELFHNTVDIVCNKPCIIRIGNRLLFIKDIDGPKLRPFLTKEYVVIPGNSEVKYFSGFVLNTINTYKTEGSGFRIIEPEPEKSAGLSIENSIRGFPVLLPCYYYSGHYISPDDPSEYLTVFEDKEGEFIYYRYKRDFGWEGKCRDILFELGFNSDDSISYYLQDDELKAVKDLQSLVEEINRNYDYLLKAGFTLKTKNLDRDYNLRPVNIDIINRKDDDWFDIKATIKIGEWEFPFVRFRRNILEGIREFELPDKTLAVLPGEWFTKYRGIFEFGKDQDDSIKIHKQHFPILSEIFSAEGSEGFRQLEKLLIPEKLPVLPNPAGLKCDMREYQVEGLRWLHWLQSSDLGGCLADDMGLGKTIQALALLQLNKETEKPAEQIENHVSLTLFDIHPANFTSLIIVPATLVYNWENEIRRFVPEMKVYSHIGAQRSRTTRNFDFYDIILSSYHTVRQDIDLLSTYRFHYLILDESQYIKNPASMVYKSVTRLKSDHRLVLTGTPVENSLTDLWAQLNFVNPGLLGSLSFFRNEFARPIEKEQDDQSERKLKKLIKPFILRRTKEMVARDLPPVTDQTVFCEMTEEQKRIYEEEKSAIRNLIMDNMGDSGKGKSSIIVLQGLMKLRQISNHPLITDEEYSGGSGKFETVLNDIENVVNEGHKILIFSSFVRHLNIFAEALNGMNIGFSMLTGASTNREKIINSFRDELAKRVFLISLKAGGVGLNLTSADYVFILDPWWNPASEMQALSRAHRIGQDKNVFIFRYISSGTLEEKIVRLQEKKSKLAESFITGTSSLQDIGLEEMLEIIG